MGLKESKDNPELYAGKSQEILSGSFNILKILENVNLALSFFGHNRSLNFLQKVASQAPVFF